MVECKKYIILQDIHFWFFVTLFSCFCVKAQALVWGVFTLFLIPLVKQRQKWAHLWNLHNLPIMTSIFFKLLSNFPRVLTETDAPSRVKIGFQSSPNSFSDVATRMWSPFKRLRRSPLISNCSMSLFRWLLKPTWRA